MSKRLIALLLTLSLIPLAAEARQFFRYKDADGQTVINSSIPPEFVKNGYEIIDDKGVVLREVAPQLSEEEIRNRRAEEQRVQEERVRDAELVNLWERQTDDLCEIKVIYDPPELQNDDAANGSVDYAFGGVKRIRFNDRW